MWQRLRTIVEETAASQAADSFSDKFTRFDEAWEGLKWLLSRNPEIGYRQTTSKNGHSTGFRLHIQASDEFAKTPEIWVVYTFDDNEVTIYEINAVIRPPESDDPEDPPETPAEAT